jgi:hypothetical protein
MEFRWVAVLTLWTLLIGPVFNKPGSRLVRGPSETRAATTKPSPAKQPVSNFLPRR